MSIEKISSAAVTGANKLVDHMVALAPRHSRVFKSGPEWNFFGSVVPGPLQSLRYSFDGIFTHEIIFATIDLEDYTVSNRDVALRLERKVESLLRKG